MYQKIHGQCLGDDKTDSLKWILNNHNRTQELRQMSSMLLMVASAKKKQNTVEFGEQKQSKNRTNGGSLPSRRATLNC